MKYTKCISILIILLALAGSIEAQETTDTIKATNLGAPSLRLFMLQDEVPNSFQNTDHLVTRPKTFHPAFFCRMEDAIEAKNNLNFKMRLGSVQYVDYLESKPGTQFQSNLKN